MEHYVGCSAKSHQTSFPTLRVIIGSIGGLVFASGETLEQADAANKAEEMDRAKELFEASLVFSQMAANHTVVYEQFCD